MLNLTAISKNLNPYVDALLNFIYPPYCLICACRLESCKKLTCENCWRNLPRIERNLEINPHKLRVKNQNSETLPVISVWEYNDAVQKIIHEMKYFRKKSLAAAIGDEMAELAAASEVYSKSNMIIPVPLHKTKLRERGFNQSFLLAERIAQKLEMPNASHILKRIRYTKSQSKLNTEQRAKNVAGAFKVKHPDILKDKMVVLVDDVLTTGSTLGACAKPLKLAGASKVLAITAAKAI